MNRVIISVLAFGIWLITAIHSYNRGVVDGTTIGEWDVAAQCVETLDYLDKVHSYNHGHGIEWREAREFLDLRGKAD